MESVEVLVEIWNWTLSVDARRQAVHPVDTIDMVLEVNGRQRARGRSLMQLVD